MPPDVLAYIESLIETPQIAEHGPDDRDVLITLTVRRSFSYGKGLLQAALKQSTDPARTFRELMIDCFTDQCWHFPDTSPDVLVDLEAWDIESTSPNSSYAKQED